MPSITYYDWVPFFKKICSDINAEIANPKREEWLLDKAKATFKTDHAMLKYDTIDPFSYIYALAQRNTKNQYTEIFANAQIAFGIPGELPTDRIFPTPTPNTPSLFYFNGRYINKDEATVGNDCLWNLFSQVFNGVPINSADFQNVLSIKNVGFTKLSQAMFLVNPEEYIPFDKQMNVLPIPELQNLNRTTEEIGTNGVSVYTDAIAKLKTSFPGCKMYEVNLLNVLLNSEGEDQLRITDKYCQISSRADGDDTDYFDDFVSENAVWTGGPTSASGNTVYQLKDFDRGDVVLVRRGIGSLGGVAIILDNEYRNDGYAADRAIKVLWLAKDRRSISDDKLGQWTGFAHATDKTIDKFYDEYPEVFDIIGRTTRNQKVMLNHSQIKHKNIILQGPPGTGKTRLAKQIANWIIDETTEKKAEPIQVAARQNLINETDISDNDQVCLIQFHPAYSYEDFVRGIETKVSADGKANYEVVDKVLAKLAATAAEEENAKKAYVLIVDEINRANLPAVLGELIYALEYRGEPVNSMYALPGGDTKIVLPPNLYIIGTMNTADRSVGHIDYAIRRRFAFVDVLPDTKVVKEKGGIIAEALYNKVRMLFYKNDNEQSDYLASDFKPEDVMIGHSYFLENDAAKLKIRLDYEIRPILKEYVKDGILNNDAMILINKLSV